MIRFNACAPNENYFSATFFSPSVGYVVYLILSCRGVRRIHLESTKNTPLKRQEYSCANNIFFPQIKIFVAVGKMFFFNPARQAKSQC